MKRLAVLSILILAIIALAGCNNPETKSGEATAYGTTMGCPVYAKVKVDGDGKVLEAEFNEYLSIYDIGRLDESEGKYYKFGTEIAETEYGYAKFVRVGDKTFVYEDEVYICHDLVGLDKSFDSYMASGEGCRWYIQQMNEGNFDIVTGEGNDYGLAFNEYDGYKLDKKKWADKMKNGFHEGVEYDEGWKENIYNLVTHIKNHGFYDYTGEEIASGKKNSFKVGKYDSLVTLENFHDYMRLAQKAYEEAKESIK